MELDDLDALNDRERAAILDRVELERLTPISRYVAPKRLPSVSQLESAKRLKVLIDALKDEHGRF